MQGRFEFDGAEVRELLAESRAAEERLFTEAQRYLAAGIDLHAGDEWLDVTELPERGAPPGLWLMSDHGVYLRSNAASPNAVRAAYARGHQAEGPVDDDPICEFIDAAPLEQLREDDTLVVTVGERKIGLSLIRDP